MKTHMQLLLKITTPLLLLAMFSPVVAAQDAGRTNVTRGGVITTTVSRGVVTNAPAGATNAPASAPPVPPSIPSARSAAAAPGVPTPAAAAAPAEEIVPLLNMDNMPLVQALDLYAELVGRTILRSSTLPMTTAINLKARGPLTKTEAISAIETVLAMNGFTVVPIGEKFMKIIPGAEAPTAGGEFSNAEAKDLPASGRFVTQIVQLKFIPIADAVNAISAFASGKTGASIVQIPTSQTLVLRDYSENIKRMMEVIEKVDTINPIDIKPEVIPIKYALAADIAQVLGSLTASGQGVSVGRSSRGGLTTGGTGASPGAAPGTQTTQPGGLTGSPSSSASRSSFQSRLQGIVNRAVSGGDFQILGEAKIIADERTNSLLIFANDTDMLMIKDIIDRLDVVLAQVLIEAIIMEVSLNDDQTVGVSYQQNPKKVGGGVLGAGGVINPVGQSAFLNPVASTLLSAGTNAGTGALTGTSLPGGFSYFGRIGNTFDVALQLAANDNRVNVLSRPRIQTSHAVEARLFIGDTVPYVTSTFYGGISASGQGSSQYQQKEVGISMNVLPLINPDGLVVMDISQNIEQLGTPQIIDGNPVPTTTKREALAKVAVKDRETIILGGFISTTKSKSKSGVPYLKDIPGLGVLFRNKTDSTKRVELMVFMRPTVLPTPEAAAIAASDERDRMPGVKQGEFEIREEERRRNEAIEADMRKKLGLKEPSKKR